MYYCITSLNYIFITKVWPHSYWEARRGGTNICVGWEFKSVGGCWLLLNDWEKNPRVYLLKWKQSVMTRELNYLDKTVMELRGHYLVVLMKQRTSHSKHCTHFGNFFPQEFLKTVDAFDLSVGQEVNLWSRCCWQRSFRSLEGCSHGPQHLSLGTSALL